MAKENAITTRFGAHSSWISSKSYLPGASRRRRASNDTLAGGHWIMIASDQANGRSEPSPPQAAGRLLFWPAGFRRTLRRTTPGPRSHTPYSAVFGFQRSPSTRLYRWNDRCTQPGCPLTAGPSGRRRSRVGVSRSRRSTPPPQPFTTRKSPTTSITLKLRMCTTSSVGPSTLDRARSMRHPHGLRTLYRSMRSASGLQVARRGRTAHRAFRGGHGAGQIQGASPRHGVTLGTNPRTSVIRTLRRSSGREGAADQVAPTHPR